VQPRPSHADDFESCRFERREERNARLVRDDKHSSLFGSVPFGCRFLLDCLHNTDTSQGRSRFDEVNGGLVNGVAKQYTKVVYYDATAECAFIFAASD
jgi:hypothetical protein